MNLKSKSKVSEILAKEVGIPSGLADEWASRAEAVEIKAEEGETSFQLLSKKDDGSHYLNLVGPLVGEIHSFLMKSVGIRHFTAAMVQEALAKESITNLTVRLFTPGGDVEQMVALYETFQELRAKGVAVTAVVDSHAASAGTVLMLASDQIKMGKMATLFIHNAHCGLGGNSYELRASAERLDMVDDNMAARYAEKTGKPKEDMLEVMGKANDGPYGRGTLLNLENALEMGFVDGELSEEKEDPEKENTSAEVKTGDELSQLQAQRARLALYAEYC